MSTESDETVNDTADADDKPSAAVSRSVTRRPATDSERRAVVDGRRILRQLEASGALDRLPVASVVDQARTALSGMLEATGSVSPAVESVRLLGERLTGAVDAASARSQLSDLLATTAASRAAFSVDSGLAVRNTVNSALTEVLKQTSGVGVDVRADLFGDLAKNARTSLTEAISALSTSGLSAADLGMTATSGLASIIRDSTVSSPALSALEGLYGQSISNFADAASTAVGARGAQEAAASALRGMIGGLFGEDIARTRALATQQLAVTSGIADLIGSDRMVASWRQSLLSEATARSLLGTTALAAGNSDMLRDLVGINSATARVVGRYADQNRTRMLTPARSVRPTRELRGFLTAMPLEPTERELVFGVDASRAVAGITAADLYLAPGSVDTKSGDLLEEEVVAPWVSGPQAHREALMADLAKLDDTIPELLQAAWQQVETAGPAAVSMASHAVVEVVDRTLRAVAPNEKVLVWHASIGAPRDLVYERDGKLAPTRAARITYALHERRPDEAKVIKALAGALTAEVTQAQSSLQAAKHKSKGTVALIRTHLVALEATLTQLLFKPSPD